MGHALIKEALSSQNGGETFFTVPEAAKKMEISRERLLNMCVLGEIESTRFRCGFYISAETINIFNTKEITITRKNLYRDFITRGERA